MADDVKTRLNTPGVGYGDVLALIEYQSVPSPDSTAIVAPGRQALS